MTAQKPTTVIPLSDSTLMIDLAPNRFLKPVDLRQRWNTTNITVSITRFTKEETTPVANDIDPQTRKPRVKMMNVMYFKLDGDPVEWVQGMILGARANVDALIHATGARLLGEAKGKRVRIEIGTHKQNECLRISRDPIGAIAGATTKPQQATKPAQPVPAPAQPVQQPAEPATAPAEPIPATAEQLGDDDWRRILEEEPPAAAPARTPVQAPTPPAASAKVPVRSTEVPAETPVPGTTIPGTRPGITSVPIAGIKGRTNGHKKTLEQRRTLLKEKPGQAATLYWELVKDVGLEHADGQAILKEKKTLAAAFEAVAQQYGEVLNPVPAGA